ncbi:hypothetical protein HMPREF3213_01556 [Heyndrickxia coagulans]|uniref:Uncharacterized protein n=1 Tax=Heyndrickxia coagulans TaxID=1398 RepID=A0A133KTI0_HEYCO|nr:hypothetical protein HMPREF3213_01556 [Heyndrickxia coagulans]
MNRPCNWKNVSRKLAGAKCSISKWGKRKSQASNPAKNPAGTTGIWEQFRHVKIRKNNKKSRPDS